MSVQRGWLRPPGERPLNRDRTVDVVALGVAKGGPGASHAQLAANHLDKRLQRGKTPRRDGETLLDRRPNGDRDRVPEEVVRAEALHVRPTDDHCCACAALTVNFIADGRMGMKNGENIHAAHSHKEDDRNLHVLLHVQMAHHPGRQQGERDVADHGEPAVQVHQPNDNLDIKACACLAVLVPVVADWVALEESDEDVGEAARAGDDGGCVDDPPVDAANGDPEQEPADGELGEEHGAAVRGVAHEPPLDCCHVVLF